MSELEKMLSHVQGQHDALMQAQGFPTYDTLRQQNVELVRVLKASHGDAIAWKYADPTEGARLIYDETELDEIASADPSLIFRFATVQS